MNARTPSYVGLPITVYGVAGFVIALMLGAVVPAYVEQLGDSYAKLMVLPALLMLILFIALSRMNLLLLILFVRGSTEVVFESTRFSLGGYQIGLGGLLNAFAILIATLLVMERPDLLSRSIVKMWWAFLAISLVGVGLSPDKSVAVRQYLQLLSNLAIFVAAFYFIASGGKWKTCVLLVLASSFVPTAYGVYQFATGTGVYYPDAGIRVESTFSHPNIFAFYLTLVISLLLYVLKSATFRLPTFRRGLLLVYMLAMLAALVGTKTRSAWASCAVMFLAYGLFFERRYLVYLVVMGALALFIPGVGDRLVDLTQGTGNDLSGYTPLNSFAWRVLLWKDALGWMTPIHLLIGYGAQAFEFYSTTFFSEAGGVHRGAHNVYMELFFELGAIGLFAFGSLYAQLLVMLRRMLAKDRLGAFVLIILVVEYLIVATSDNMLDYLSFNWYLWFITGAGAALGLRAAEQAEPEAAEKIATGPA